MDLTKPALAEGTAAFAGQPQRSPDSTVSRALAKVVAVMNVQHAVAASAVVVLGACSGTALVFPVAEFETVVVTRDQPAATDPVGWTVTITALSGAGGVIQTLDNTIQLPTGCTAAPPEVEQPEVPVVISGADTRSFAFETPWPCSGVGMLTVDVELRSPGVLQVHRLSIPLGLRAGSAIRA